MSKKTEKELFGMALEEHLDLIMRNVRKRNENEDIDQVEAIIRELEPEKQHVMEQFMDKVGDREAEIARRAYIGGLLDGVKIAGVIWLEALRGQGDWEAMIE